jgi:hypothetical protein
MAGPGTCASRTSSVRPDRDARDSRTERGGAVPDPCRQSAISHIPPVAHDARCAGKHRRLAGPDEDAGNDELPEAPDQSSRRLGERPDEQAEAQQAARTNAVRQRPARKLAESVRPEERRNGGGSGWYIRADADWGWILGRRAAMDFR